MKAETFCARVNLQSTRVAGAVNLHDTLNTFDENAVCLHPHGTAIEVHHVTGGRTASHVIAQDVCPFMVLEDEVFLAEMAEGPSVDADLIVFSIFQSCAWQGLGRRTTFCIGILIRVSCCVTFIAALWHCARRRITAIARHVIVFTVTIGVTVITTSTTGIIISVTVAVSIVVIATFTIVVFIIIIATSITTPSAITRRRKRRRILSDLHLNVATFGGIPRDANLRLAIDGSQSGADLSLNAIGPGAALRGDLPRRAHAVLPRGTELLLAREQLGPLLAPAGALAILLAHAFVEREAAARDDLPGDGARACGAAQVGGDAGAHGGRRGAAEAGGAALRSGGTRGDAMRDALRLRHGGRAAVEVERDVRKLGERGAGEAGARRVGGGLWRLEEGWVRRRGDGGARGEEEEGQQQEEGWAWRHGGGAGAVRRGGMDAGREMQDVGRGCGKQSRWEERGGEGAG